MDPAGVILWLGQRLASLGESLLRRSARLRSFDAEVLEASMRTLNVLTDATLAVLSGQTRDPALLERLNDASSHLWLDPGLIPDHDAVTRLTKAMSEALLFKLGMAPEPIDPADLRRRIIEAQAEVTASAYKRRRELA